MVNVSASVMGECTQYERLLQVSSTYSENVHGYLSLTICIIGGLSNVANIVVLTRRHMVSSTNLLLCAIAVANLLTMLACMPVYVNFYIINTVANPPRSTSIGWIFVFLAQINFAMFSHTVAVWLTITLALFRYLFIAFPLHGGKLCTLARANTATVVVCLGSAMVCIPNVLCNSYNLQQPANETDDSVTQLAVYEVGEPSYITESLRLANYWVIALFIRFIPCVLLTLFTILLSYEMHKASLRRQKLKSQGKRDDAQRRRESKTTLMLFAIVVSFLIIELPQGVLTVLNALSTCFYISIYIPLGDFIDLLTLFKAVVNFILFTIMSQQFRDTFSSIFLFWLFPLIGGSEKTRNGKHGSPGKNISVSVGGTRVLATTDEIVTLTSAATIGKMVEENKSQSIDIMQNSSDNKDT